MSAENKLLFKVGSMSYPQEGVRHLLASVVIQARQDVEDLSLDRETRRGAKTYIEEEGNAILEHMVGKTIPLEILITC